jgi:hypothetical protein
MIFVFALTAILFAGIFVAGGEEMNLGILAFMIFILFIIASFGTLTVMIDGEYLRIKFGYGIFQKKFKLSEIVSAKTEKHKWYHGWGIRYWIPTGMWIFNVSGWDVLEIEMTSGKKYRIGSDEVEGLVKEIKMVITK